MAQNMARIGLPSQQYNNQRNAINQNQAGAVSALANSANPGANLASIVRAGDNATGNLNAADAQSRVQNQHFAIGQNTQLGQQELARQQYNNFDKYTEQFNKAAALQGAENQNIQNGINGAGQLAGSLYGYGQGIYPGGGQYSSGARGYLQQQTNPFGQSNYGIGNVGYQTPYNV